MLKFEKKQKRKTTIECLQKIIKIETKGVEGSSVTYEDGSVHLSKCIKCANPKCMYVEEDLISDDRFSFFSCNSSNKICVTDALKWDYALDQPVIDSSKCIKCGLCANRCPIGAIKFDEEYQVVPGIMDDCKILEYKEGTYNQIESAICRFGKIVSENDLLINDIYDRISRFIQSENDINLLVRNIFIALGCKCYSRRTGDNYTRMDDIFETKNGIIGTIEVEFGQDALSASRRSLEDIAVLHSRYKFYKEENTPVVVCLSLPNFRQGYWQVVKDISNIENIKINTISIGALLILIWNNKSLDDNIKSFYADFNNNSIREALNTIIGYDCNIPEKHLGLLEPSK